jgi:hypothetical protein
MSKFKIGKKYLTEYLSNRIVIFKDDVFITVFDVEDRDLKQFINEMKKLLKDLNK